MKRKTFLAAVLLAACPANLVLGGGLGEIDPFAGDFSETWEAFQNYNDNPNVFLDDPTSIMDGMASIANDAMLVYEPGVANFGLGSSGPAQVSDGVKGMGLNAGPSTAVITFATEIFSFGAYWGAATRSGFPDPAVITVAFYTPGGGLIGEVEFQYSHSDSGDGVLDWHGWSSGAAIGRIEYTGDFVVIDGLQALVPGGCGSADTNCDGTVDAFDIAPFLDLLYGNIQPCAPGAGDVNGDGIVDAFDIQPFIDCLFGGGGKGQSDGGRLYFDLDGNVPDAQNENDAPHPGDTAKENPMLDGSGRLFIYWEFGDSNQDVLSPNYDITIDGGTITHAWNYNDTNMGGIGFTRWEPAGFPPTDYFVEPWNFPGGSAFNPTAVGGPSVSFTSASIVTFGLTNDAAHQAFDNQLSIADGPFGSTLLGYIDVSVDPGQSSATVWITVGQQGIAISDGDQQTPISFGFGDASVGAGDVGLRTQIAEATIVSKSDCPADLVVDGVVGVKDLLFLLGAWGPCPPKEDCPADLVVDGVVGVKDLLFLLGAWGPCPGPPQLVYSHEFVEGVTYCPGDPQYDDWLSFRASIPTSGVTSITLSGSQDPTGRTCSDPVVAQQIADAMRNQTTLTVDCGGFTWRVGIACQEGCGLPDNDLVLSVGGPICSCGSTYVLRPGIGNRNWGGITGASCFVPTQTMTVTIE